ncbi:MAG: glycosyltransferase family 4 protein [Chloroflexi bacterium]|nr:glycosyltransferase family 4 protein [Chloroflexota bacterium]
MNIGMISTRLAGTDGVSLETAKLAFVLEHLRNEIYFCAGELAPELPGLLAPELHFTDPAALNLRERAFGCDGYDPELVAEIGERAQELKRPLTAFLQQYQIDYLIIQNVFAIPMQLPLGQALTEILQETGLPALAHNHDFYWERPRYSRHCLGDFLDKYFPPDLPNLRHAVINSAAQRDLKARRGIDSLLLPNVFHFETPPPPPDAFGADFRQAIGLTAEDWLILQPTRVIPRKGIELAIELLARLNDPRAKLVITHHAGDEGLDYLHRLQDLAAAQEVDLHYVADRVGDARAELADGRKIYTLWDTYPHADFVTYPSLYEGFGNALIETVYFRKPALVNRYSVYVEDIAPRGFQFIEIDGAVTDEAVTAVRDLLTHPQKIPSIVDRNYQVGLEHFSYGTLQRILEGLLAASY